MIRNYFLFSTVVFFVIVNPDSLAQWRLSSASRQAMRHHFIRCLPQGFCWNENQHWHWVELENFSGLIHPANHEGELKWHILPSASWPYHPSQLIKEFQLLGIQIVEQKTQGATLKLILQTKNTNGSYSLWQQNLLTCHRYTLIITGPKFSSHSWNLPEVFCRE